MVRIKRVYEPPARGDGYRVLVDRLWPRGIRKEALQHDAWLRDLAPSTELRKRLHGEPELFAEFEALYLKELRSPQVQPLLEKLTRLAQRRTVTLLFAARDAEHNNAVVLAREINRRLERESTLGL
ncbi:MAG TPA: DUF488 domain-containing protein [Myxococcales bacterium]|nr:DUF488 domain-containing protein [Myxococcales bacterium]